MKSEKWKDRSKDYDDILSQRDFHLRYVLITAIHTLADLRVALDTSIIALAILFQAFRSLASTTLFVTLLFVHLVIKCCGILHQNSLSGPTDLICSFFSVLATNAGTSRKTKSRGRKTFTIHFKALATLAVTCFGATFFGPLPPCSSCSSSLGSIVGDNITF